MFPGSSYSLWPQQNGTPVSGHPADIYIRPLSENDTKHLKDPYEPPRTRTHLDQFSEYGVPLRTYIPGQSYFQRHDRPASTIIGGTG